MFNYKEENTSARVGELKNKLTVKEAIVAVPYVISNTNQNSEKVLSSPTGKEFFKLPKSTVDAALNNSDGAGSSIRRQILLMQDYVLPPQFDFLSFPDEISPIVMYFFEFKHDFDRDDLSYMWQNLMPRNYDQIKLQTATCEHVLHKYELMSQDDLTNNENLRWMIFKVKQRRQSNYYDYVANQYGKGSSIGTLAPKLGQSAADIKEITNRTRDADLTPQQRYMQYNWPYDFFSIIESIKIDTEALYKNTSGLINKYGGSLSMGGAVIPDQKPWEEYGIETMGGEGSFWDPPGGVGTGGTWRPPIGSTSADDEEEKKAADADAGTEEKTEEEKEAERKALGIWKFGDAPRDIPPAPPPEVPKEELPPSSGGLLGGLGDIFGGGGVSLGGGVVLGGGALPKGTEGKGGVGTITINKSTAAGGTGIYSMGPSPMKPLSRKASATKKKY